MKDPSILQPKPCGIPVPERVFYVPCDLPSKMISSALGPRAGRRLQMDFFSLYSLGKGLVLIGALGAPAAALGLERLIKSGAKEVILLGFCGSLSGRFRIADVVSIKKALVDEGTSPHYFARKRTFSPSLSLKAKVEKSIRSSGLTLREGVIVSTDAPYRETGIWLERMQGLGAEVVDMETSAVFALAAFHGLKAASLQVVSDELGSGLWKAGFRSPLLERTARDYFLPLLLA